ncbi:MAG: TPM domain-containing protein [Synechocystis sp.]|nr:TPM domain-containing protein [Synechocystis sp.]
MTVFRLNVSWIGQCLRYLGAIALPVVLALSVNLVPALATGVYDLPIVGAGSTTHLIDQADSISLANENRLNGDLKKLAQATGQEVRFVVIRRLDFDTTIEDFADQLFSRWYPDPEAQDNQTLLVLDTLTNSTALRQGEAAQALLSEDIADSLLRETIAVPLKDGAKYNQALIEADKRLSAVLSGQGDPGPPTVQAVSLEGTFATAEETDDKSATVWVVVLLALATLIPMVTYFWYVGLPGR